MSVCEIWAFQSGHLSSQNFHFGKREFFSREAILIFSMIGRWSLPIYGPRVIVESCVIVAEHRVRSRVEVLPLIGLMWVPREVDVMSEMLGVSSMALKMALPFLFARSELWSHIE